MSKAARRLGRGLDSLVSDLRAEIEETVTEMAEDQQRGRAGDVPRTKKSDRVSITVPVDQLSPNPFQPRSNITVEDVLSLARSIARHGILQPIPVRPVGGRFEIIAGERRWTAARQAGLTEVPVLVREATDEQMLELALIENLHREDLNPIDRAKAYRNFCGRFHFKPDELAERLGEDRTTVANFLRLLELPEDIRGLVATNKVSMGHARCLLSVDGDGRRRQLTEAVVQNELSVRALEEIVRREKMRSTLPASPSAGNMARRMGSPHVADLQRRFEESLKTKVRIQEGKRKGSGRITIDYFSLDDFERIAERLGVEMEER